MIKSIFAPLALFLGSVWMSSAPAEVLLNEGEIAQTLSHGPWPPAFVADPSNRVSGQPNAIALGEGLFFDPVLSRDGTMSCADCHDPAYEFADPKARSVGKVILDRNAPSLVNVRGHRWFGWAGGNDNLWAQSLVPILNPDELDHDKTSLMAAIANSTWAKEYEEIFGKFGNHTAKDVSVNIAKSLAAYQETLETGPTSFDSFRSALERKDFAAAAQYPQSAQRGLQFFLGRGNCAFCHSGPAFTNREFHDAGVPYFIEKTRVDTGRHGGLKALFASPFTLEGAYSDDPEKRGAWAIQQVRPLHSDFGTFRVPSLRGVARTAPYMHNGSLADLEAVVEHYNTIDMERLHTDGEAILAPLALSGQEAADLLQFLLTLSDDKE